MFSPGQIVGILILGFTVCTPGLALGGFHGGTRWSIFGWLCVSILGGFLGGLLLAPKHRISGALGGLIGAPFALIALYLYSRNRDVIYNVEAGLISLLGGLPGFGVFFVLRLLSDAMFPARRDDDYDEEEDERPRRRKRRRDEDDEEEDDRPRSRRRRQEDDEKPRAHRRRGEHDYDEEERPWVD